jgi:outer membrane protein TolC
MMVMNFFNTRMIVFFVCFCAAPGAAISQSLTLDKAQSLARSNYPLIKQKNLIARTADINIANLGKGYLPQFSINGQASYQSAVTEVDVPIPGLEIDAPEKDQYKLTADINQLIYDGGATKQQKSFQQLNAAVEQQQVEVELFKLKERINQVYLGILYLDEQIKQVELVRQDLQTGLNKVRAQVQNGVAFRSNENVLRAEVIRAEQRSVELRSSRAALIETLSLFVNQPLDTSAVFEMPDAPAITDTTVKRPEIKLFSDQSALLNQQNKLINARNMPRTSLFLQGGYGRPGLNLLKNEFDFFYIGGVRLSWQLGGLYTAKNDKELVKINRGIVDLKKDVFLLNTNAETKKQRAEINKLQQLISSDKEIIDLRKSVTASAKAQLENGVMTASDYLREINNEDQARQTLITHEIQLLQAEIAYETLLGNGE